MAGLNGCPGCEELRVMLEREAEDHVATYQENARLRADFRLFAAVVNRTALDVCRPDGGLARLAQAALDGLEVEVETALHAVCPDCGIERADYEGVDAHLPTCPNCGTAATPKRGHCADHSCDCWPF